MHFNYKILKNLKINMNSWVITTAILIAILILPLFTIIINVFTPTNENWQHLVDYLLKDYIINSLILIVSVGIVTSFLGVFFAWILANYEFKGSKFFEWALILPLAVPSYICAYTYSGMLSYTGIIQKLLREYFNYNIKEINIMSIQGAVFIFSFTLYPYVYLTTKSFIEKQSAGLVEASRSLGETITGTFFRVILPLSRASIFGGATLVVLEVLNDYGVVKYFGIPTFSTAIFKSWLALGDKNSAIKLSAILMFLVLLILGLEKTVRGRKSFSFSSTKVKPIKKVRLTGYKLYITLTIIMITLSAGFVIPVVQMLFWSFLTYKDIINISFFEMLYDSFSIAFIGALVITLISIIIANVVRLKKNTLTKVISSITNLGYSIPGAVIAIGVMTVFINFDKLTEYSFNISGSILMLFGAYIVRFLAISYNSVYSGFEKVGNKFHEASRSLGNNITQSFFKVDFHLVKSAVFSGFILTFIDILKELPLTLILRPFNLNTLATKAYEYADDEMLQESSSVSIILIIITLISILYFYKLSKRGEK